HVLEDPRDHEVVQREVASEALAAHRHLHEHVEAQVEEAAEEDRPHEEGDVGDGAAHVVPPLLLHDGADVAQGIHALTSALAGAASAGLSVVVRCRKISSRLMPACCRPSSPRPLPTTAEARSARTSRPASCSTSAWTMPWLSVFARACSTPGTARSAERTV